MFTKPSKDEVLLAPHLFSCIALKSAEGWIQGGAQIGHWGPFLQKKVFFRPEG